MSSLKAPKSAPRTGGGKRPELEAGTYPGRLVQVIDLGLQPQRPFQGQPKPPKHCIMTTYELSDEFMLNEDGEPDEERPLWVSEDLPMNPLTSDLAKSTKRYEALDPDHYYEGDWSELLGQAVNITIVINKKGDKVYQNIVSTAPMRAKDKARIPELKNEPKVFALSDPDMETFLSFPEWLQEKIKGNLEYAGSKLEQMLAKGGAKPQEQEEEEDEPKQKPKKAPKDEEGDDDGDW